MCNIYIQRAEREHGSPYYINMLFTWCDYVMHHVCGVDTRDSLEVRVNSCGITRWAFFRLWPCSGSTPLLTLYWKLETMNSTAMHSPSYFSHTASAAKLSQGTGLNKWGTYWWTGSKRQKASAAGESLYSVCGCVLFWGRGGGDARPHSWHSALSSWRWGTMLYLLLLLLLYVCACECLITYVGENIDKHHQ